MNIESLRGLTPLVTYSNLFMETVQEAKALYPGEELCMLLNRTGQNQLVSKAAFQDFEPQTKFAIVTQGHLGKLDGVEVFCDSWLEPDQRFATHSVAFYRKPMEA